MIGMLIFIAIFVIVIIAFTLTINTHFKKSKEVDMPLREFQRLLKEEGLSEGLTNFATEIIKRLQVEEDERAGPNISYKVINRLSGWDYSAVFEEQDYINVHHKYKDEINKLHEDSMSHHGFTPSDVGEARHTEGWHENALHTESIITQKISDVVSRYKNELV